MKLFGLAVVCVGMAYGQSLSIGVIGGVPFTDAVASAQNGSYPTIYTSPNFVVGPSLQVNLPASLRVEVDALFRPIEYQVSLPATTNPNSAHQWTFPVLMQYRFKTPVLKPFLSAGLAFDHLTGISEAVKAIPSGPGKVLHTSGVNVVLGAGVEAKIPFMRLSGELRFSRAAQEELQAISKLNQAEVILGIHF